MPKYMLLLHDRTDGFSAMSPEQMQHVIQKYMAWGDKLRNSGILQDGQKLTDEPGRVIRTNGGQTRVTDGPYSETKEVLGGYYTIAAGTYDEAVEIAGTCPHVEYGGTIEVRQVDDLGQ
jgi:hypothetical protein